MLQMRVDVSASDDRTLQGEPGVPDFFIQTTSGTETMADRWFGTVAVNGTANWTVTRIVASGPLIQEIVQRMTLTRSVVRGAFSEMRSTLAYMDEENRQSVAEEFLDPYSMDPASCYGVEAPIKGRLKHEVKSGKKGG
jgi:hypothetical protein